MAVWEQGGGFSADASVSIEAADRAGLERLLRYCTRPEFSLERLREINPEHMVYPSPKPGPGGSVSLILMPMELLDRLAALIPPPRRHRHRYAGVLVPNSPLRSAVTALVRPDGDEAMPSVAAPASVPEVWWRYTGHRFHHRTIGHTRHPRSPVCADLATASETGAWAPFVEQARRGARGIRPTGATCAGL